MLYGIKIGDYHTLTDWGLYLLRGWKIPPASENRYKVQVPGADGYTDLTESLTGRVTYANRKADFTLKSDAPRMAWYSLYHEVVNAVHGKTLDIIIDTDPEYTMRGFVTVGQLISEKRSFFTVKITVDLEPFKWENSLTECSLSLEDVEPAAGVTVTEGDNVSKQYWNTDMRFGTQEFPTYDFSIFSVIRLTWTGVLGNMAYINLVDGNGNAETIPVPQTIGGTAFYQIDVVGLVEAGIDPSTMWRILVTHGKNVKITGWTISANIEVQGGERSADMVIDVPDGIDIVVFEGTKHELTTGLNAVPAIELKRGSNMLLFMSSETYLPTEGEINVSYRKGWL